MLRTSNDASRKFAVLLTVATSFLLVACAVSSRPVSTSQVQGSSLIDGLTVDPLDALSRSIPRIFIDFKVGATTVQYGGCSGTLISSDLVLTASHCVSSLATKPNAINVVSFSLPAPEKDSAQDTNLETLVKHHMFFFSAKDVAFESKHTDLALIHLHARLGPDYSPIPLLRDRSRLKVGSPVLIAGFGGNEILSSLLGRVSALHDHGPRTYVQAGQGTPFDLVVVRTDRQTGTTHGDSGGPGLIYIDQTPYLWGADSRGYFSDGLGSEVILASGARSDLPAQYFKVSEYVNVTDQLAWITQASRDLGADLNF